MTLFKALQLSNACYGGENTSKVFTILLHNKVELCYLFSRKRTFLQSLNISEFVYAHWTQCHTCAKTVTKKRWEAMDLLWSFNCSPFVKKLWHHHCPMFSHSFRHFIRFFKSCTKCTLYMLLLDSF
jgi:hypothetical protein